MAHITDTELDELREALDDLWGCIRVDEMDHLQRQTLLIARANHARLHHAERLRQR